MVDLISIAWKITSRPNISLYAIEKNSKLEILPCWAAEHVTASKVLIIGSAAISEFNKKISHQQQLFRHYTFELRRRADSDFGEYPCDNSDPPLLFFAPLAGDKRLLADRSAKAAACSTLQRSARPS